MNDSLTMAATLLVVGPIVGTAGLARPALFRAWTAPREEHLALVRAHRRDWALANAGFTTATVATAAGLALLAGAVTPSAGPAAVLIAAAVAYAIAGALWCAVVAIRDRTTPALAEMVAAGTPTEPAETLIGAAIGGLFTAFMLVTSASLVAIGLTLTLSGGVAAPVAWLATLIAAGAFVGSIPPREVIPAVIYLPTFFIGLALLLGWS